MAKFCFNPMLFNLPQYTLSVICTHGTGSIFNVLNNSLQDVFLLALQINPTTFFCNLQTFVLCESPHQKKNTIYLMQVKICKIYTAQSIYTCNIFK